MENVLILGDGLLGNELIKQSGWDFVSRKLTGFDINNIEGTIPRGYDVVINCIANTNTYGNDKNNHWEVNYKFVNSLIDYCNIREIKLVHISTDYIYAGSENNATEESVPVHHNSWYGYTKLLSDGLVQLNSNDYLLYRCSHKLKDVSYDEVWNDQLTNTDYVDVIASLIIKGVNKNLMGVYNVGTEVKTMYELVKNTKKVIPINSPDSTPKNVTMNIDKYKKDI